jgi:hypothetical protein
MCRHMPFFVCLFLSGCIALNAEAPLEREIEVAVLGGGDCGGPEQAERAEWITRPGAFNRLQSRFSLPGHRPYSWNADVEGLLLIHMGTRPTGGYRIELAAPAAKVRNSVAVIDVNWREPDPGSMVTQAITAPCLLLKVPRQGIKRLVVKDQHRQVRFEVTAEHEKGAE